MTGAVQALLCATALASGGGGSGAVSLTNRTVSNTGSGTGTITCGYKLDANGNAYKVTSTNALLEAWLDSGAAADFEVQATLSSGNTPTGTLSTWQALSADRTWSLSAGAGVLKQCTLTIKIRDVATQTVQDTATISIKADNSATGGGGGGAGGSVSISNQTISDSMIHSATSTASYQLNSDGNAYDQSGLLEAWLDSGSAGDFQARATLQSGTLSSGTTGTWLALSTSRSWTVSISGGSGSKTATILVEIRDASSLTVLDSATISITADSES